MSNNTNQPGADHSVLLLNSVGVVNTSFPLSDQPVFGEWLIFVEVQGHTYNKSFEVQKYGTRLKLHTVGQLKPKMYSRNNNSLLVTLQLSPSLSW